MLPLPLPQHQLGTTSHNHPTSHSTTLQKHINPKKNLWSQLGLGLKFILTPSLTNSWSCLRKSSYNRLFCSVHLWFRFAGKPPSEGTTSYDPKLYVRSKWMQPHWTIPPVALEEHLSRFSEALGKLFKTHKGKKPSYHTNNELYECCNNNKHS